MLRQGQVLFTYLHLAADKAQTEGLMHCGATCIAYETVTDRLGTLPLLAPMSEVAGRMSVQVGAHCLEKEQGGAGVLLGGVPGVAPAKVVVLGGGVSGTNAARMAVGLEASVTIIDKSLPRLKELDLQFGPRATTLFATADAIEQQVLAADLVIGAVLVPGAAAPKLVTREMVRQMRPGSVLVDIAIDQGGCFATSRPTTHSAPTYVEDGVVHYCVTNMPGAVARTSTFALTNATLPFVIALAEKGWRQRAGGRSASAARAERACGQGDVRGGGARPEPAVRAGGDAAGGVTTNFHFAPSPCGRGLGEGVGATTWPPPLSPLLQGEGEIRILPPCACLPVGPIPFVRRPHLVRRQQPHRAGGTRQQILPA